jgi:hypothetical protein
MTYPKMTYTNMTSANMTYTNMNYTDIQTYKYDMMKEQRITEENKQKRK